MFCLTELHLCRKYKVAHLEVFGFAADEERFAPSTSNIDFLIEFLPLSPSEHAKAYFGLLAELQDIFQRQIDLVESKALTNPYLLESLKKTGLKSMLPDSLACYSSSPSLFLWFCG